MIRALGQQRLPAAWVILLLSALLAPASQAQEAQSPAQLRRENDALREKITELEAAIAQADDRAEHLQKRIEALEAQLRRAQQQAQAAPQEEVGPGSPMFEPGPVPDDRFACPSAMKQWLSRDFADSFSGPRKPTVEALKRWANRARLERATVLWDIRLLGWRTPGEGEESSTILLICFDWRTGENLCEPFELELNAHSAEQLRAEPSRREWTIEGVFAARPTIAETPIDGDDPDRISDSALFDWSLTIRSITPFDEDDPKRGVAR